MKNNRVLIISGGHCSYDFVSEYLLDESFQTVIAVDKGLMVADKLELSIHYLLGDFDSVSSSVLEKYYSHDGVIETESRIKIIEHKPEKDATDTELALELAIGLQPDEIIILGATGTRFDHMLANVHLLKKSLEKKISTYILDDFNKISLINQDKLLYKSEQFGDYISVLPYTDIVENVTLEGFKYPLYNHLMKMGYSLGVSNELVDEVGKISLTSGILIIIESRD